MAQLGLKASMYKIGFLLIHSTGIHLNLLNVLVYFSNIPFVDIIESIFFLSRWF